MTIRVISPDREEIFSSLSVLPVSRKEPGSFIQIPSEESPFPKKENILGITLSREIIPILRTELEEPSFADICSLALAQELAGETNV